MGLKFTLKKREKDFNIGNVKIGKDFLIIAGPCAVESKEQLLNTALYVKDCGAHLLRAMVFKPRTSPYSFQGLGVDGLKIVEEVKEKTKMPVVTEIVDPRDIEQVSKIVDVLQIGARNMQNYALLKEVGRTNKVVILKRGLSATIEEWLNAAEYVMNEGNDNVILCERGIRTFITETRFTLDLSSIPILKKITSLPIIVDPSHAAGASDLVKPLAKASKVIGADGLIVEVHPDPKKALSDNKQQLNFDMFKQLMLELNDLRC
jgi:3-deoxy-7-phosphoheptulonate synthase